jgi:glutamine synthetase type III
MRHHHEDDRPARRRMTATERAQFESDCLNALGPYAMQERRERKVYRRIRPCATYGESLDSVMLRAVATGRVDPDDADAWARR